MATNTIQPWFLMLHQAPPPPRWINLCSYGSFVFWPCMCTGWVLEMSPSDHYWQRYEVGQWLVFGWFGGWGTSDTWLARRKLDKKNTPQSWWLPSLYSCHGGLLPAQPHTALSQHAAQQVYVVQTREYYCFYYLLAFLRHDVLSMCHACVFMGCISERRRQYHTLSGRCYREYDTLSAVWLCYYANSSGHKK